MSKIADADALTGKFFVNIADGTRTIGVVTARVRDGVYLTRPYFSPTAPLAILALASVDQMTDWAFYESVEEWSRAVAALNGGAA